MSRTNIDIDDDLMARVMAKFHLSTKKAAVDFALREVLLEPMTRDEMLAMEGYGWHGDLEDVKGRAGPRDLADDAAIDRRDSEVGRES